MWALTEVHFVVSISCEELKDFCCRKLLRYVRGFFYLVLYSSILHPVSRLR